MQRIKVQPETAEQALQAAVNALKEGLLVVFPTETVYGLAADATSQEAITRLLKYKERPAGKAISVMVENQEKAEQLVELNASARQIFQSFLPGPVTVVCKDKGRVDHRLTSEFGSLGIRISSHPLAAKLASTYGNPVSATSANAAGDARPYDIDDLLSRLSEEQRSVIGVILDVGPLPKNEPSTVIDTTQEVQHILRSGEKVESLAPPFYSLTEETTQLYAERLMGSFAHVLPEKAVVFALEGDMGLGKTQFAKGVAKALGVKQVVTSPTFTLIKEYPGEWDGKTVHFIHLDLWRLEKVAVSELGLEEYIHPKYVLVIEWAAPLLPYLRRLEDSAVVQRLFMEEEKKGGRTIRLLAL